VIYSARRREPALGTAPRITGMASDTQLDMESADLERAVQYLREGGIVAIPTDTLYGLAVDVFNRSAIDRVFAVKGRPKDLALPVLVGDWNQVKRVAKNLSPQARTLADSFWPGGLTLVLEKADGLPDQVTAEGQTVAVRMPDHPVPIHLTQGLGLPITGTSANISGRADLLSLTELTNQIGGLVDQVITAGPEPKGIASTVIDITGGEPKLLRQGVISFESILEAWETGRR